MQSETISKLALGFIHVAHATVQSIPPANVVLD